MTLKQAKLLIAYIDEMAERTRHQDVVGALEERGVSAKKLDAAYNELLDLAEGRSCV